MCTSDRRKLLSFGGKLVFRHSAPPEEGVRGEDCVYRANPPRHKFPIEVVCRMSGGWNKLLMYRLQLFHAIATLCVFTHGDDDGGGWTTSST